MEQLEILARKSRRAVRRLIEKLVVVVVAVQAAQQLMGQPAEEFAHDLLSHIFYSLDWEAKRTDRSASEVRETTPALVELLIREKPARLAARLRQLYKVESVRGTVRWILAVAFGWLL